MRLASWGTGCGRAGDAHSVAPVQCARAAAVQVVVAADAALGTRTLTIDAAVIAQPHALPANVIVDVSEVAAEAVAAFLRLP